MRYVEARLDEYNREEAYRIYVSNSLQLIPQNKYIGISYLDMLNTKKEDQKTGDDIIMDIMNRAGLKFEE